MVAFRERSGHPAMRRCRPRPEVALAAMPLRRAVCTVLAAASVLIASGGAATAPAAAASSYCSPTGDYCYSARVRKGAVRLVLGTFSFRGQVRVCVTPPDGGTPDCKAFRLAKSKNGIYEVDVKWSAHFPRHGPGTYRVSFAPATTGGAKLGPGATFRRGS